MGLLPKFLQSKRGNQTAAREHSVIVDFYYGSTNLQHLYALDDSLRRAISESGAGRYDGYDVAGDGSKGAYFMFGPDAEKLLQLILPLLNDSCFMNGASVTLWFGPKKRSTPKRVIELPVKSAS